MLLLRRVFLDGTEPPEIVLIHYTVSPPGSPGTVLARGTRVVAPRDNGRREATLFLPEPPAGGRLALRYFFSTTRGGAEWFSPRYEIEVPGPEAGGDLIVASGEPGPNLPPAAGLGYFRMVLPLEAGERPSGIVRYGFGAMRKKPTPELCRASIPLREGEAPVVEAPEALAVLKNRPMPYFVHRVRDGAAAPVSAKINSARITFRDEAGDVLCARLLWADPSWAAPNFTPMDPRGVAGTSRRSSEYFFSEDRDAWVAARAAALAPLPLPRTFEAYVFGPAGTDVEYCFQVLRRGGPAGRFTEWRNRDGGNFRITL